MSNVLYDFYQWMPGHGENSMSVNHEGTTVVIGVRFDGIDGGEETRILKFSGVSYCAAGACPGLSAVGSYDIGDLSPAASLRHTAPT